MRRRLSGRSHVCTFIWTPSGAGRATCSWPRCWTRFRITGAPSKLPSRVLDLGPGAACSFVPHSDGTLTGSRFLVAAEPRSGTHTDHHHDHHHHDDHHHDDHHDRDGAARDTGHGRTSGRCWRIPKLHRDTKQHAIGIFRLLAQAEAEVHGVAEDDVAFHEVGAIDSIVDIVAAAELVARLGAVTWWSSPLPLGSGRIRTQHGLLPVPAPATALLLRGMSTIDDGIAGERVTPTGAAVARYLLPRERPAPKPRRLVATGTGFGTRVMPGISNCLRVLVFEPETEEALATSRRLHASRTRRHHLRGRRPVGRGPRQRPRSHPCPGRRPRCHPERGVRQEGQNGDAGPGADVSRNA